MSRQVKIVQNVLINNDAVASSLRLQFQENKVFVANLMAAPGAGKTSFISRSIEALKNKVQVGVIEGDIAGSIDTEKVLAAGATDAVQINTSGKCHLEGHMIEQALGELDLSTLEVVFIENVGNLICPTLWDLGEGLKVCLVSTAEGDDKPIKYPSIFAKSDVVILNKIDLIDFVEFDKKFFYKSLRTLNPNCPIFELSCRTKAGFGAWIEWLESQSKL